MESGSHATQFDEQLNLWFDLKMLFAAAGSHVDDVTGTCRSTAYKVILAKFCEKYDDITENHTPLEGIGVMHVQDPDTLEVVIDQKHYSAQLRPISVDEVKNLPDT